MTAIPISTSKPAKLQTPEEIRRARVLGLVYIGLAALVLFAFTFSIAGGDVASFGLSRPTDAIEVSPLEVPARALTIAVAVGSWGRCNSLEASATRPTSCSVAP